MTTENDISPATDFSDCPESREIIKHGGDFSSYHGIDSSIPYHSVRKDRHGHGNTGPDIHGSSPILSSGLKTEGAFSLDGTNIRARCGVLTSGLPTMPSTGIGSARHFSDSCGQRRQNAIQISP